METLKKFLIEKKSKDAELIRFVSFLVKSIRDFLEVKTEESTVQKEREETKKKNDMVRENFLSGLHLFDEFVLWAKEYTREQSDFIDMKTLEELQNNTAKYSAFLQFRKIFSSKYMEKVVVPYENLFKKNNEIEEKNYSTILRDLNYL